MLQNDHHNNFRYHLSPQKVITLLLTTFYKLYVYCSPVAYLFYNCNFIPLNTLHPFHTASHLLPHWQPLVCSICENFSLLLYLFDCFFLGSIRKWNHMINALLHLTYLLRIMPSSSIHVVNVNNSLFLWLNSNVASYMYKYVILSCISSLFGGILTAYQMRISFPTQ